MPRRPPPGSPAPLPPPGVPAEAVSADPTRPVRRPIMLQRWDDLASLHWRYDPAVVQALLPRGLRVDTHDGAAWVGMIPFHMRRIRLPGLPALGPLSTFPETNIRTYVVDAAGRRAVWFASLEVSRLVPALVAQVTYRLPYCWAAMTIEATADGRTYASRRRWPAGGGTSRLRIRIGDRVDPDGLTPLDHFLTARWALASSILGRLLWAEVDHPAWTLHRAEVIELDQTLTRVAGLPDPEGEPYALWSPGVDVRIGRPHPVRGGGRRRTGRRERQ